MIFIMKTKTKVCIKIFLSPEVDIDEIPHVLLVERVLESELWINPVMGFCVYSIILYVTAIMDISAVPNLTGGMYPGMNTNI